MYLIQGSKGTEVFTAVETCTWGNHTYLDEITGKK